MSQPEIRRRPVPALPPWQQVPASLVPALRACGLTSMPPLLTRLLQARGLRQPEQADLGLQGLPPPSALAGMAAAVALLEQAVIEGQRILVVGDYDADGATATATLLRGLALLGAEPARLGYLVPDRFVYGYGLSPAIVELALQQGRPDLLITVDNGIASHEGVALAREHGIRVLVTDHHLPGDTLPEADALLNPRLQADSALQHLAGVGVVFYLLVALRARWRELGRPQAEARMADLLDLVALGTVADLVPLDRVNRVLVEQGLRRIRAGQCVPGITALLQVGRRDPARVTSGDLGFIAGPRLNAAGRLADMGLGIDCLLSDDPARALAHAEALDRFNRERRQIEQGMREAALEQVHRVRQRGELPAGLVLHDDGWHEGVVGILAARVREQVHRPVVALAPAQEPGMLKGSGRSVNGLHLRDVLDRVATRHPGLLVRFGGHAMAAGLTLARSRVAEFAAAFQQAVLELALPGAFDPVLETDGPLAADELTRDTARLLETVMPWGQGLPPPCFDGEFEVLSSRVVGERHLKLTLGLPETGAVLDAVHFNAEPTLLGRVLQRVHLVYRLDLNRWQGRETVQLVCEHLTVLA